MLNEAFALKWTDVHTHINMLELSEAEALELARRAGVERMITIGTEPSDHQLVLDLAERGHPRVYAAVGVHPHEAQTYTDEVEQWLLSASKKPGTVALGEMGLDYYYSHAPHDTQREVFRRQLELALATDLPVEIHTRDAEADTVAILREFGGRVRGLLHCFTGTQWLADEALSLGLNISISGVVSFKNANSLRQVVASVPLERLHLETDAPFLAPVPHRGKKNHPALLIHTAQLVAEIKQVELHELSRATEANCEGLFKKMRPSTS